MNAHTPATPAGSILPLRAAPTRALTDLQVADIIQEAIDACDPPADLPPAWSTADNDIARAALSAYEATLRWKELYDAGFRDKSDRAFGQLFDARERMQDAVRYHAELIAIQAIGSIGDGWLLQPGTRPGFYELWQDGGDDAVLVVPRDLPHQAYRAIIRAYETGREHGKLELQADFRRLLGLPGAVI
ncbi:hypothetical protein OKC48_16250 [Methylorubrum extorquens]|uniref:hypothetical protein n=1 Tax=Methylorubrum extorquens TaxID=408 RepID=UPI002237F92E|nr:hypothetical protein [Methylorubrum extorquens]UYW24825.1 hypothetical protein OKC48_16250 [Methylorubrum extorquens]